MVLVNISTLLVSLFWYITDYAAPGEIKAFLDNNIENKLLVTWNISVSQYI